MVAAILDFRWTQKYILCKDYPSNGSVVLDVITVILIKHFHISYVTFVLRFPPYKNKTWEGTNQRLFMYSCFVILLLPLLGCITIIVSDGSCDKFAWL